MAKPARDIDWRAAAAGGRPTDAPSWIDDINNPYLHGVYAPIQAELDAVDCAVEGDLPRDLEGIFLRNGPNSVHRPPNRYHWFDGDGMVHSLMFRDGRAIYRNRWVRTDCFLAEGAAGHAIWPGMMGPVDFDLPHGPIKDTANTDLVYHHGNLLALWYNAGDVYALDPVTLAARGKDTLRGTLRHRMSAHAHVDEANGELLFFNYSDLEPHLSYGVAGPDGAILHEAEVPIPGVRLPHDMGFTEAYAILHDLPLFHDTELLRRYGKRVTAFHRRLPARFGVIPRRGSGASVRWFEAEPCYVLHVINSWEEDDWLVMDGCRSINPLPEGRPEEGSLASLLAYLRLEASVHRWRFNLRTGETREQALDDLNTEFPTINTLLGGRKTRYAYLQYIPPAATLGFRGVVKYDTVSGRRTRFDYGATSYGSEAPFAPCRGWRPGDAEDDGYVVSFITDVADWSSHCVVLNARDIEAGPVCRVRLPQRLPAGFHTTWIRGDQLFQGSSAKVA